MGWSVVGRGRPRRESQRVGMVTRPASEVDRPDYGGNRDGDRRNKSKVSELVDQAYWAKCSGALETSNVVGSGHSVSVQ